jgi:hypothetical protein
LDFAATPNVKINWGKNTEHELFSIPVQGGSGTGTFELDNTGGGGGFYFEVSPGGDITNYADPYYQNTVSAVPLPIELASFSAAPGSGNQVLLTWATVSEKNNYGFEVQKSLEAKSNYQTIPGSFIKGHGTTLESHTYSYTVTNPGPGNWYYRLKQMDLDGTTSYTDGIQAGESVKPVPKEFALDQNYPNPFNPTTTISYAMPKDGRVTMEVFNVIGQRVALLVDEYKEAGYHTVPFDAHALASGIYFYRFVTPEVHLLKKMMVLK